MPLRRSSAQPAREFPVLAKLTARGAKADIQRSALAVADALEDLESRLDCRRNWSLGAAMAGECEAQVELLIVVAAESSELAHELAQEWMAEALAAGQGLGARWDRTALI